MPGSSKDGELVRGTSLDDATLKMEEQKPSMEQKPSLDEAMAASRKPKNAGGPGDQVGARLDNGGEGYAPTNEPKPPPHPQADEDDEEKQGGERKAEEPTLSFEEIEQLQTKRNIMTQAVKYAVEELAKFTKVGEQRVPGVCEVAAACRPLAVGILATSLATCLLRKIYHGIRQP